METLATVLLTILGVWLYNTLGHALGGWASRKRNQVEDEALNPLIPSFVMFWPLWVPFLVRDWLRTRHKDWYIANEESDRRHRPQRRA